MVNHACRRRTGRLHLQTKTVCRAAVSKSRYRAAAAVELAIVLPVLLTIGMMTIDFGGTVSTYLVLSNAARTGADHAATHHVTISSRAAWDSHIRDAIADEMSNYKRFDSGQLQTVTSTSSNVDGTTQVVVDVRYSHETIVPWPGIPARIPLHYRIEMRQYQ